jgi:hypothetical protein
MSEDKFVGTGFEDLRRRELIDDMRRDEWSRIRQVGWSKSDVKTLISKFDTTLSDMAGVAAWRSSHISPAAIRRLATVPTGQGSALGVQRCHGVLVGTVDRYEMASRILLDTPLDTPIESWLVDYIRNDRTVLLTKAEHGMLTRRTPEEIRRILREIGTLIKIPQDSRALFTNSGKSFKFRRVERLWVCKLTQSVVL